MSAGAGQPGTVSVLFTDLVGSTELRQRLGDDRADEVQREHDRVLRTVVGSHGGSVVKGTGDGVMVVFSSSAEAVGAAVDMQRAMARAGRRLGLSLALRVGLSAGDVSWDDGDCFGTPVVEARRLCDAAAAGEVLVSEVVRLLAGSRGGHRFAAREPLTLKGLAEPVANAQVVWEPDRNSFVPLPAPLAGEETVTFVGRPAELDRIQLAWKRAHDGSRQFVLLAGEPGVGKTRLAAEVARGAYEDGGTVLYGRCDEDPSLPYQPFVEALSGFIASAPTAELADHVARAGGDIARLLPQIAERVSDIPPPVNADPETERHRLFEAVLGFITAATSYAPVMLVLDDLHWAAKPTLLLLRHLLRRAADVPLLIVGTYRDTDLDRTHPLAGMLAELRDPVADRIALRGLTEPEVLDFVARAAGQEIDANLSPLARAVYTETEGNPFFVGQVLRHLVETGAVVQEDGQWRPRGDVAAVGIPEGVREVIGRRVNTLPPDVDQVLMAASVLGRDFDADHLVDVVGGDGESVYDALEHAERARLIHALPGRAGRYTFAHALVRSTLYGEIVTTRRLRLHKRAAESLAARRPSRVEDIARHYCEAAALTDADVVARYGRAAADRAAQRLAWEEAADWYGRLLAALDPEQADHKVRGELFLGLGWVRWTAGDRALAQKSFDDAMAEARLADDAELFAAAAVGWGGRRAWTDAGVVDEELVTRLEEALERLPDCDSAERAMAMARLAGELYFRWEASERRQALTEAAIAMARRVGDRSALAFVLLCARYGMWIPGNARERLAVVDEVVEIAAATDDRELSSIAHAWRATDLWDLGRVADVRAAVANAAAAAEGLRMPEAEWTVLLMTGCLALFEGRNDDARRLAEQARVIGERLGSETAMQFYGIQLFALHRVEGGLEDLAPLFEAMVETYPLVPAWRCGMIFLYVEVGQLDEARRHFAVLAEHDFELPFDANWTVGMAVLAFAAAALGEREAASRLYERMQPYADTVITIGLPVDVIGPLHMPLAPLAAALGDWAAYEQHLQASLDWLSTTGGVPWLARTMLDAAAVLLARDHPGDAARAHALAVEAADLVRGRGMPRLEQMSRDIRGSHSPTP